VQGFTPFKNGNFLMKDIQNYIATYPAKQLAPIELMTQYAGGKFGTLNAKMAQFITQFYNDTGIALDGIYNGKMVYGIFDLVANNHYPEGSVITAVHTGGVQGNQGLNARYGYHLPE
jgi:1-aminocyclopropane-1-carboxylate deaminase